MRVGNPLDGDLVETPESEPMNIIGTQAPDVIAPKKKNDLTSKRMRAGEAGFNRRRTVPRPHARERSTL